MPTTLALLLATAAAAILPLALVGLPESFASSGQDAEAALLLLHGFAGEMAQGAWWPRWLVEGNRGFGSPAFLFYPPVAYWVAAGLQRALHLDEAGGLVLSAILWRVGAAVLAYAWLRTRMGARAALFGTALFSLHVYTMLVDPLVGFTYAEIAGTCVMFLGLLAAGSGRPLLGVPPAFALLAMTHLPLAVMAGGVLPAWAFVTAETGREGLVRAGKALAGCLLGAALAGAYLVPALLLLPEIFAEGWETGGLTTWSGHFLLDSWTPSKPMVHFIFMNAGLVAILASLAVLAWIGHRRVPPLRDGFFLRAAILLLLLCLLMTPLSWPVWWALPPLQKVQFPWRFMVFAVALWAMLVGWRLDRLAVAGIPGGARFAALLAVALGSAALWIPFSALTEGRPEFARYDWTRVQFAKAGPQPLPARNMPEYAPRAAARAGWQADAPETDAILQEALDRSRAAAPGLAFERDGAGALRLRGRLESPADLVLPQLAFPAWGIGGQPVGAALSVDAGTGLLRLDLPAGEVDLRLFRTATGPERIGWAVSGVAVLGWLGLAAVSRNRVGQRRPSAGRSERPGAVGALASQAVEGQG